MGFPAQALQCRADNKMYRIQVIVTPEMLGMLDGVGYLYVVYYIHLRLNIW